MTRNIMAKILIAEDEPDIRELIRLTLSFKGFEVLVAEDGYAALELAEASEPDLVLLDVRMPGMSGYEVCQRLRQLGHLRETPMVFLSAKGQEAEVENGLAAGADDYILKPFAPDELVARLEALL
ncbi:MAG: response regulator [Candidatus Promineifilaceae bacterium]|nr:response regulator [Candidatus Promineifilaceae bacterium]